MNNCYLSLAVILSLTGFSVVHAEEPATTKHYVAHHVSHRVRHSNISEDSIPDVGMERMTSIPGTASVARAPVETFVPLATTSSMPSAAAPISLAPPVEPPLGATPNSLVLAPPGSHSVAAQPLPPVHQVQVASPAPRHIEHVETPAPAPQDNLWVLRPGQSLRQGLTEWARRAGWHLVWQSDSDYILQSGVEIDGPFIDAIEKVVGSYQNASPSIKGDYYIGNKTYIIQTSNGS